MRLHAHFGWSMEAPIKIPNFELDREIGRGGMSYVYLARQLEPKRHVAIKIVAPGATADPAFLQSLKQEGDTIASLSCDNIVTVYACGVIDLHYYLAMEVLSGGDLSEKIKKGMRPDEALDVMLQVGNALKAAHAKTVLHRDIKPENVMFHESGKAVLVDFGIAKEADTTSSFTQVGAVVGTPHYMSPERCMGKSTDHRSDIYAMGVMFFEMLTGKKVYEGRDTFAVSYAHVYEPVPPLPVEQVRYQNLVNRLLAKDPEDRVQTAVEMIELLKRLKLGEIEPATRRVDTTAQKLSAGAPTIASTPIPGRGVELQKPLTAAPEGAAVVQNAPKKPPIAMIAGAALAIFFGAAVVFWPRPNAAPNEPSMFAEGERPKLSLEQDLKLRDLLAAAESQIRLGNTDDAEENYIGALMIDCTSPEGRRGLEILNAVKFKEVISGCKF